MEPLKIGDLSVVSLQKLQEIEGMEEDLLLHEIGLHYDTDNDIYSDTKEGAIDTQKHSQEHQQQGHQPHRTVHQVQQDVEVHQQQPKHEQQSNVSAAKIKPKLSLENRRLLIDELLIVETNGKLPLGIKRKLSKKYNIHRMTLDRLWKDAKAHRNKKK